MTARGSVCVWSIQLPLPGAIRARDAKLNSASARYAGPMTRRSSTALSLLPLSASLLIGCASAQSLDAQSGQLKAAIDAAERGQLDPRQAAALSRHPAYGWVEFAQLRRNIDTVDTGQAQAFLKRYDGQAVANSVCPRWPAARTGPLCWPTGHPPTTSACAAPS